MSFYSKNKKINKDSWNNLIPNSPPLEEIDMSSIITGNNHSQHGPFCTNCHKYGHVYKRCQHPQESYGIVCARFKTPMSLFLWIWKHNAWKHLPCIHRIPPVSLSFFNETSYNTYQMDKYKDTMEKEILMICRKHSFSYIEWIRGKYNLDDTVYITYLLQTMTNEEIHKILTYTFEEAWRDMWSIPKEKPLQQLMEHREYIPSKKKWDILREGTYHHKLGIQENIKLDRWISEIRNETIEEPEWGFPKGRKEIKEDPLETAKREFLEETNLPSISLTMLHTWFPTLIESGFSFLENYYGSNHIHYHLHYYPALYIPVEFYQWILHHIEEIEQWVVSKEDIMYDWMLEVWKEQITILPKDGMNSKTEISEVEWISLQEGIKKIRSYQMYQRSVYMYLKVCFEKWLS
jgi:8-oxo-dGTP pyrophosphatase MutT (NUDIX family)